MKYEVTISFEASAAASADDIKDYIKTELECAGGNRHPYDPLFHSLNNVQLSYFKTISHTTGTRHHVKSPAQR